MTINAFYGEGWWANVSVGSTQSTVSGGMSLGDRYVLTAGRMQLTGIQALARLPIDQHRRDITAGHRTATFISGYEGSPLAGYDLELGRLRELLEVNDVIFKPGLNEEAAATAVQGSQLANTLEGANRDGVIGMWYGKAPGLERASDASHSRAAAPDSNVFRGRRPGSSNRATLSWSRTSRRP
ncbi:hypothetical protein [Amycolatopsis pithecellobii]|uniref:Uncharacterized protein n=1 Tax=Amycolatopsis pithecellobii TaxID=664692 RepID=A0A6N7Z4X7_9PSEU|nr:hypothetical protein [Amycolatopsis pithecellobii]MTD55504.1 hypothetical protein [Amycolatopsis pithecellobii]